VQTGKRTRRKSAPEARNTIGNLINQAGTPVTRLEAICLKRLRKICLAFPETKETVKWGHPTFEAGKKAFAVLDHYHGEACIAFRTGGKAQSRLLRDKRFYPAPYAAAQGWVCLRMAGELDWSEVGDLMVASYRLVALKRMLAALEIKRG